VSQLIFYYTAKHQKIIYFFKIYFPNKNYFPANKRGFNWLFGLTRLLNYFLFKKKNKINKWEGIFFFEAAYPYEKMKWQIQSGKQ